MKGEEKKCRISVGIWEDREIKQKNREEGKITTLVLKQNLKYPKYTAHSGSLDNKVDCVCTLYLWLLFQAGLKGKRIKKNYNIRGLWAVAVWYELLESTILHNGTADRFAVSHSN